MKKTLEELYDIPFHVVHTSTDYYIFPENEMEELFEIHIQNRSNVRLVVEVFPQKHAGNMLSDMKHADEEKQKKFLDYYHLLKEKDAKVDIKLNEREVDFSVWPDEWKNLAIRISKVEDFDNGFDEIAIRWAKIVCGMMLSLLNIELVNDAGFIEGKKTEVTLSKYERNPLNRQLCIEYNGSTCKICGFNFEEKYGDIGKGFIHVHHIIPISLIAKEYVPNPKTDLIPVCPNCHAMLHSSNPPLLPEELISKITTGDR